MSGRLERFSKPAGSSNYLTAERERCDRMEARALKLRVERDELLAVLRQQTDYLASAHALLNTLPIPSEHAFDGARRYSEVLSGNLLFGIAHAVATARVAIAKATGAV